MKYAEECVCPCSANSFPPCQIDKDFFVKNFKCPRCGGALVLRKGYSLFYGCSNYPRCDYAISIDE
ncbi:MAG: topoisomerase DNA-binding C4 zinc finger domain-containing protein [Bacteroidales bacterium]|nr:topoisomerase DNA-binding C4 zinc finger domain-containing protein [Bacteroidales bacterium]